MKKRRGLYYIQNGMMVGGLGEDGPIRRRIEREEELMRQDYLI